MTGATEHAHTQGEARTWERPELVRGQPAFPTVHMLIIRWLVYANRLLIGACYNGKEKAVDF